MNRLLLAAVVLTGAPAYAQTPEQPAEVDEVVVTATRAPSLVDDTPGARVISGEEIERRGVVFAAEVLETVPGVNIVRNGGFGGVTSVRQRGQGAEKTLVLIDGVPANDPSQPNGGFDLSSFELADVARVEVLSGPQGSLWGSDAIGGVISFVTRETDGVRAEAEAGSYGTVRGALAAGRASEAYAYGVSLSGLTTDGLSKAANGVEADGFDTRTLGASGRYTVSDRVSLDGRVRYNEARSEVDGYDASFTFGDTPEVYDTETVSAFVRLRAGGVAGLDHAISVSLLDTERAGSGGQFPYSYSAERRVYRYTAERGRARDPYAFAFGVEREDTAATLSEGVKADLGASAAFAVLRLRSGPVTAMVSGRYDDPDRYDGQATGRASLVYAAGAGLTLEAAYGQGFRTPSISQTACDLCFPAGPADLRPERAEGGELGVSWRSPDRRRFAALTAYRLKVRDQIEYVSAPDFTARYRNIAATQTDGFEAEASADLGRGLSLRAAYAYADAVNRSTGARLVRVPEHQGSAVIVWTGRRVDAALTLRGESSQADSNPSTFAPEEREGFVTADLAASYALTDGVRATLRVENLGDAEYQQALGYREAGRSAYLGLRLRR